MSSTFIRNHRDHVLLSLDLTESLSSFGGLSMRVVVDSSVHRSVPDLLEALQRVSGSPVLEVFEAGVSTDRMVEVVRRSRPEIVLVDPEWLSASSLLKRVLSNGGVPAARIVVGYSQRSQALDIRVRRLGFFEVVSLSELSADDLVDRLVDVASGVSRLWVDPKDAGNHQGLIQVKECVADDLDIEIIELVALGLSDREIADGVHLSLQAVRNRVSGMLDRSGCSNRTHLGWAYTSMRTVDLICPIT